MRRNRFWKRPFALALSLCILFSAFGQISYAGDSAETEPVTQVIDEASSNPNSSSEPGTQSQGGQDENVPDDSAAGGDTSGDAQTDGDNPGGDSTESDNTGDKESGGDSTEDGNTGDKESGGDSTEGDNTGDKEPDGDKTEGDNTGDKELDGDKTEGDNIGDKEPGGDKTESDNIGDKDPDKNENPDSDGTQDQWVKVCPKHMEHDDSCGYIEGKHSCEHSCYYCVSLCEHHQDHSDECGFHDPDEGGEGAECNYSCEICNKTAEPSLPVCPNHPIHDESCGYMEGTSPCGHSCEYCQNLCEHHLKHDDECGYKEGESPCKFSCPVCGEELKNLCKHHTAHDESCGYIKGESPCKYVCKLCQEEQKNLCPHHTAHDETCGYVEGVSPCAYECEYCKNLCPHHTDHTEQCGFEANGECSFLCNRCVAEWAWVDEEEYLVYSEETGLWYLPLPVASPETSITREILAEYLPKTVMINTEADTAKDADKEEENPEETPEDTEKDTEENTEENKTPYNPSDAVLRTASETPEGTTESTTPEETPSNNPTDTNAPADTETDAGGDTVLKYAQTLTLTWDLTAFPEAGAWEGTYTLTAKLPEEYALAKGAEELMVVMMIGEGEIMATTVNKYLNWWGFVPRDGTNVEVIYDGSIPETTALIENLDHKNKDEILQYLTNTVLPTKIRGWGSPDWGSNPQTYDGLKKGGFIRDKDQSGNKWAIDEKTCEIDKETYNKEGNIWGLVDITKWEMIESPNSPTAPFKDGDTLTVRAYIAPKKNDDGNIYQILLNSNDTEDYKVKDNAGNLIAKDSSSNPKILNYTVILKEWSKVKEDHIVTPANPQNVTVNLFDYWVEDEGENPTAPKGDILPKSDNHYHEDGGEGALSTTPTKYSTDVDWNKGINQGHLLLFGDGMIHAGLWNKGAGENCRYGKNYAGMEKIVKNVLVNGYPEMNLALANQILTGDRSNRYVEIKDYALTGDHIDETKGEGTNKGFTYNSSNIKNLSDTVIRTWGRDIKNDSESLDYLFDETEGDNLYKKRYENVTGLFQLDNDGYYYYNMRKNFAEFSQEGGKNHFILYDAPATTRTDGKNSIGNFFPFNSGIEVFNGYDQSGNLTSSVPCSNNSMNHHLGMTVEVNFRQSLNGNVVTSDGNKPMTFEFSGDDDVWVFIDDVLVLDIGGIHSDLYGIIDFATGGVYVGRGYGGNRSEPGIPPYTSGQAPSECVIETTIRDQFRAAGKEDDVRWMSDTANTFASNTSHTLKMFYLERGNYDSSLALRFNLQSKLPQRIMKVDQYGSPVANVEFKLYEADICAPNDTGAIQCLYTDSEIEGKNEFYVRETDSTSLVTLTTNQDGYATFQTGEDQYFNFADRGDQYYILKETAPPLGYRRQPIDIVLHYDTQTSMLSVANRWTTGAYACSFSNISSAQSLNYATLDDAQNELIVGPEPVPEGEASNGLVVAVPMLKNEKAAQGEIPWMALYGGNIVGFNSVKIEKGYGDAVPFWRAAVLGAALMQAAADGTAD